jgi:hypothetical protein
VILRLCPRPGRGCTRPSLLGRLRAEYALVMLALQRELEAEADRGAAVVAMGAARVLIVDDDRSTRSTLRVRLAAQRFCGERGV